MVVARLANFGLILHRAVEKGVLLFGSAIFALLIANSHYFDIYNAILHEHFTLSFGNHAFKLSLEYWINDFLMAIFFLVVGTEIKRELIAGHLANPKQRLLPVVAAIGGVLVPILIYLTFNYNDHVKVRGWAIPAATDIAFALGVLLLLGKSLPAQLKIFLTALAIIDDLIAIVMIAFFYTETIVWYYIACVAVCVLVLLLLNRYKVVYILVYLLVGLIMWYCCYMSGIHATIAGVILGFSIPLYIDENYSPLRSLEHALAPFVSYIILPMFAFANSGILLSDLSFKSIFNSITLGITVGLFFGKQIGIFGAIFLLVKCGVVQLQQKISMLHYYVVSIMCGIGFTMSLFIGILSFENQMYLSSAKIGVMLGSALSCVYCGIVMLIVKLRSFEYD